MSNEHLELLHKDTGVSSVKRGRKLNLLRIAAGLGTFLPPKLTYSRALINESVSLMQAMVNTNGQVTANSKQSRDVPVPVPA